MKVSYPLPSDPLRETKYKILNASHVSKKIKIPKMKTGNGQGTQGLKGTARGIQFDSYWEFAFYIWCTEIRNGTCVRNHTDFFIYRDEEGKECKFYPDFITNEFGLAEVKGIYREKDLLKKDATDGVVTFFGPDEMKKIIKEVFAYKPNWKSEYTEIALSVTYGQVQS